MNFFYLHIEIQNNINSFCENEIFIKITNNCKTNRREPKTKSSHWELLWKEGVMKSVVKTFGNTCEEVHFLVTLQALNLQVK